MDFQYHFISSKNLLEYINHNTFLIENSIQSINESKIILDKITSNEGPFEIRDFMNNINKEKTKELKRNIFEIKINETNI